MENRKLQIFNLSLPVIGNSLIILALVFDDSPSKSIDYTLITNFFLNTFIFGIPQYLVFLYFQIHNKGISKAYKNKKYFPYLFLPYFFTITFVICAIYNLLRYGFVYEVIYESLVPTLWLLLFSFIFGVCYLAIVTFIDFIYLKLFNKHDSTE